MSNTDGQTTQAPAEQAQPKAVRYTKGQSCVQLGAAHAYVKVEGKNYERCSKCGSTRTVKAKAPATETPAPSAVSAEVQEQAAITKAAEAPAAGWVATRDLSYGTDFRGDQALFLYRSHVKGWDLDRKASAKVEELGAGGPVFFRLLDESGRQTGTHGWAENGKVTQWG